MAALVYKLDQSAIIMNFLTLIFFILKEILTEKVTTGNKCSDYITTYSL